MSDTQTPAPAAPKLAVVAASPKLNAIQIIEQELKNFYQQKVQAIANVNAVEGAIQGAERMLTLLRAEEAKAASFVKAAIADAEKLAKEAFAVVEPQVANAETVAENDAHRVETDIVADEQRVEKAVTEVL